MNCPLCGKKMNEPDYGLLEVYECQNPDCEYGYFIPTRE